jgi:DNA-binding transcriptional MerR regulator
MQVGEIASKTGVSVRAIRYYEDAGLLRAERRANGYRQFEEGAVEHVRVIRDLLESGFTVAEIRSLWHCVDGTTEPASCCDRTVAIYRSKLDRIEEQMRTLNQLKQRIEERVALLEPC